MDSGLKVALKNIVIYIILISLFIYIYNKYIAKPEIIYRDIHIENEIDSTYIITLKDSISSLMYKLENVKPQIIKIETVKDSFIYIQPDISAKKGFSYDKTLSISDSILTIDTDINVYGIDSVFVYQDDIFIKKNTNIKFNRIKYKINIVDKQEDIKTDKFALYVGAGAGAYSYDNIFLGSFNPTVSTVINERHMISFSYYSGNVSGFSFSYKYLLFKF